MNRTGRIVLAVVVGFLAAGAAMFAASTNDGDGDGEPVVLGGVDVFAYCVERYGALSQALVVGANAFGWRCTNRANGLFRLEDIDVGDLCVRAYGPGVDARVRDSDDPYSWECVET